MNIAQDAILSEKQKSNNWRGSYTWLAGFSYFFQGYYVFGTRIYILTMMSNWDVPTGTQATVLAIIGLPAYLKMLPGLLSDRMPVKRWGRRKPYIFLGGLVYIPSYLLLIKIQDFGITWIAAILLFIFAWLLADTSLDAMTVDITPNERIGHMQGAAQGSQRTGAILGTMLIPLLGPRIGWTPMLLTLCTGAVAQSGVALLFREPTISREVLKNELSMKWVLQQTVNHKLLWLGLFFILFFSATQSTSNLLSIYLLSELGWSASPEKMQTFALVSVLSMIASALGAFLTGRLPSKTLISFRFNLIFVIAFWIFTIPWLLVNRSPEDLALVCFANISVGIGWGVGSVLSKALAMRVCPKSIEGFSFALMMSVSNFGSLVVGTKTASVFVDHLGGVVPAIFTLIPYGLISLVFVYPLLQSLYTEGEEL